MTRIHSNPLADTQSQASGLDLLVQSQQSYWRSQQQHCDFITLDLSAQLSELFTIERPVSAQAADWPRTQQWQLDLPFLQACVGQCVALTAVEAAKIKLVIPGPISFAYGLVAEAKVGQEQGGQEQISEKQVSSELRSRLLETLLPLYSQLFYQLKQMGIDWLQLNETELSGESGNHSGHELSPAWQRAIEPAYHSLRANGINLIVAAGFDGWQPNLSLLFKLPVQGVHLDQIDYDQLMFANDDIGPYKVLSLALNAQQAAELQGLLEVSQVRLGDRLWLTPTPADSHEPVSHQQALSELSAQLQSASSAPVSVASERSPA